MERRIYPLKELELYEVPLEIDELQEKEVPSTDNLIAPDGEWRFIYSEWERLTRISVSSSWPNDSI